LKDKIPALEVIAGVAAASLTAQLQGKSEPASVELVTREYFGGLGPHVRIGRGLSAQDHLAGSEPVVVISHSLWQRRFGGRSNAIGETITVSGRPKMMVMTMNRTTGMPTSPTLAAEQSRAYRIIGVMAPESSGTFTVTTDLWIAFEQAAPLFIAAGTMANRVPAVSGIARLKPGATIETVRAAAQKDFANLGSGFGVLPNGHVEVMKGVARDPTAQRDAQRQVRLLLAGGVLLALVAAANVSLFLLSRAPSRQRELSIRSAVGASSTRLVRQLATEAAMLVVIATALGWLIGLWLAVFMQQQPLLANAQWRTVSSLDWQVLAILSVLALMLTILVALAPIIGLRRTGIAAGARMLSGRASFSQRVAGVVQISIAGVVVSAAIAFGWHLNLLANADVGFGTASVLVVSSKPADPRRASFNVNPQEAVLRRERQRNTIAAIPGVDAAAFGSAIPGRPPTHMMRIANPDSPAEPIETQTIAVDGGYRTLLNMRLISGVDLDPKDSSSVLVNETFARTMWKRTDVVGEMIGASGIKVSGVLKDASYVHPADKIRPMMYRTSALTGPREFILVRSTMSQSELRQRVQEKIDRGELEFEIDEVKTLDDIWGETLAADRARSLLTAGAAVIVVLLAALGFYSTQSYLVNAGRREYAIRSAVGAGPKALGRLVLLRGVLLGVPGLVLAGLLSVIAIAWLRDGFVSAAISPIRVVVLSAVSLAVLVIFTTLNPARRARHTEPAPLLREE
jgi:putative ABC transport system permease protein